MVQSLEKHPTAIEASNDQEPKAAARRLAARRADPNVPSPQSDASHDDDKPPSGSGG